MTSRRRTRRGQGAQAAVEMALVLPVMIVIVLGFVGMMLELRAENEFQTALNLAAQASLVPPLGDPSDSRADALYAFSHTLNPAGGESGYITVTAPVVCSGEYFAGIAADSGGVTEPVTCTAQANLDFSRTPVSLLWFWPIHLSASAQAYPSPYRRCAPPSPGAIPNPNPYQC